MNNSELTLLIEPVARRLLGEPNHRLSSDTELRFGTHGSLAVIIAGDKRGTWFDHEAGEGGGVLDLVRTRKSIANGEALDWLRAERLLPSREQDKDQIAATYDYCDADGRLLFQVVRKIPKTFRQRRPDGNGGWAWNLNGVERVLYRLPALIHAPPTATIYIVEGEKDCNALHERGLIATTNPGGAGKWLPSMSEYLRNRHAVILPDNDAAGEKHVADVATKLHGIARSIRVLRLPGLPEKGDVSDWLASGGTADLLERLAKVEPTHKPNGNGGSVGSELLISTPADSETSIPRRAYVVPYCIPRGVVTELIGPGSAGKSQLTVGWATALALGQQFGRFKPERPMRVALFNVEDDIAEQQRRVAAALRVFGAANADLGGRLTLLSPKHTGMLLSLDQNSRTLRHTPLMDELLREIDVFKPDLVILDPLIELHDAPENDNTALRHIIAGLRIIARTRDIAILLLHHTPKGDPRPGNQDAGRGASSVGGVVRKSFTLFEMTMEEGRGWRITRPQFYFRLDGAKANHDAKNGTEWFERVLIPLDNGDVTAAAQPWEPPVEAITDEVIAKLLDVVARGDHGKPWSKSLGNYERSISRPLRELGIGSRKAQQEALAALFAAGCVEAAWEKTNRDHAKGLRHPDDRTGAEWVG